MKEATRRTCHGILAIGLATAAACDDTTEPLICTDQLVYGVQVEARDSITGLEVTTGLSGILTEDDYQEDMAVLENLLWGAPEREGVYAVTVEAMGYLPWTRTDVDVDADECHVIPVQLEALLQPN